MWKEKIQRLKIRFFIFPIAMTIIFFYFNYHVYHGYYGWYSLPEFDDKISILYLKYKKLVQERIALEKKILSLHDGTIEKDKLDEYVRMNLNLSEPNEVTVLISQNQQI